MHNSFSLLYLILFLAPSAAIYFMPPPARTKGTIFILPLLLFYLGSLFIGKNLALGGIQQQLLDAIQLSRSFFYQLTILPDIVDGIIDLLDGIEQILQKSFFSIHSVITLLFLWGYLISRSILLTVLYSQTLIEKLIIWLKQLPSGQDFPSKTPTPTASPEWIASLFFLQKASKIYLVLLVILFSSQILWFENLTIPYIADYFSKLFWAGSWIVLLETGAFFRSLKTFAHAGDHLNISGEDAEIVANADFIQQIFKAYQNQFPDCLFGRRVPALDDAPTQNSASNAHLNPIFKAQMPQPQAIKAQEIFTQYNDDKDIFISETLTYFHMLIFMEMIMHCIHHKGTVLVVAPPTILDELDKELATVIDAFYGRFSLRIHNWQKGPVEHRDQTDLHFCSPSALEAFIENPENVISTKLMLVLHADALDKALLRHESERMELLLRRHSCSLVKVAQMQEYFNDEQAIRSMLVTENLQQVKLFPTNRQPPMTLVWNANQNTETKLKEHYQIDSPVNFNLVPLIFLNPLEQSASPVIPAAWVDEEHRFDADLHEHHTNEQIIPPLQVHHLVEELFPDIKMVIIEDFNNLFFKLFRNIKTYPDNDLLLHIVCHPYLLRDFMLEKAGNRLDMRPRTNIVQGRKQDLARQIIREIQAYGKIDEQTLAELIDHSDYRQEINADYKGLFNLLDCITQTTPELCCRIEQGRSEFCLRTTQTPTSFNQNKTVLLSGHEKLTELPKADYGLTYAAGMKLLLENKFYRINKVTEDSVEIAHAPVVTEPRRHYFFERHYSVTAISNGASQSYRIGEMELLTHSTEVSYQRTTDACLELADTDAEHPPVYSRYKNPINYTNQFSTAVLIGLTSTNTSPPEIDLEKVEYTLAAILQEIMLSLFPNEHQHIVILSCRRQRNPAGWEQIDFDGIPKIIYPTVTFEGSLIPDALIKNGIQLMILEDSETDLGVLRYFNDYQNIISLIDLANDFLQWADSKESDVLYHCCQQVRLPLTNCFDYPGCRQLLQSFGTDRNGQALLEPIVSELLEQRNLFCDFCGNPAQEYATLSDQRVRCKNCSQSAIDTVEEFETQLKDVMTKMENNYHIEFTQHLRVEMVNASTLHQRKGEAFLPSDAQDPRAIGFATVENDTKFLIVIENGFPKSAMRMTIAHELTHIWQYCRAGNNINSIELELLEGQASFIEVDFARHIDNNDFIAKQAESQLNQRNDCYGEGYRKISQTCHAMEREKYFELFARQLS